jgi:glycerate kinase
MQVRYDISITAIPSDKIVKILICPDKFKGSLNAEEVCNAISKGIRSWRADAVVESVPLADGGEGTCDLLTRLHQGKNVDVEVCGPRFMRVKAHYGISNDGKTAFIEMAEASGLTRLRPEERNPLLTTTYGTGEMIGDALIRGVKKIVLGIGGSATNDAGIGMATALGYVFFDAGGEELKPTGENLIHLHHLNATAVNPALKQITVVALCDVTNPLYGPEGAAYVYGPQKGADQKAVELLDAGLRNFRRVVHKQLGTSVDFPGSGAAGGLGAGVKAFLNATIQKGVNYIIACSGLEEKMKQADLVITGEGKIDNQTFSGKVVSEVMRLAAKSDTPVVAVCGACEVPDSETRSYGLQKVISLVDENTSTDSAMKNASRLITERIIQEISNIPSS